MSQTVIGVFDSATEAQNAVSALKNAGFDNSQIDTSSQYDNSSYDYDTNTNEGGIGSFFSSLFDSDDDVKKYSTVASRGTVVTVHTSSNDNALRAASILDQYGAIDADERYTAYSNGTWNDNMKTGSTTVNGEQTIELVEENLEVGKREVASGGVRVRSMVIEKPVQETVRLRKEQVFVNRTPVNRTATEADFAKFKEGTITMTETDEVAVVGKTARVTEEVTIGKNVEQVTETINDTVRKTDVVVEEVHNNEIVDGE